ncbi:MAG: glycosyltransferase [Chloroflexi bacterium]|nr:glycosyltransferase [Chloroflexota bacterium]
MRLIIGTESYYPNISGLSVATYLLATRLAKRGHSVSIMAPSMDLSFSKVEVQENLTVIRFPSFPNPFRHTFRVTFFPGKKIDEIVTSGNYDLVLLQDPTSIGRALKKAALKNNIPVTIYNHFSLDYVLSYLSWLRPLHGIIGSSINSYLVNFYNGCAMVFAPSRLIGESLKKSGVKARIEVVSTGVDLSRFYSFYAPAVIRKKFGLPVMPVILHVGRLDEDKGLETLFGAIKLIPPGRAHFLICGGGNLLEYYKKKVKEDGNGSHVTFTGPLPHEGDDLPQAYQIADIFVIPSTIETQSIVTMEAMASGLPVIAANSGALPELVEDGVNGFLFSPGDPTSLAEKIVRLLESPDLARRMGDENIKSIGGRSLEKTVTRMEELFMEVINNKE